MAAWITFEIGEHEQMFTKKWSFCVLKCPNYKSFGQQRENPLENSTFNFSFQLFYEQVREVKFLGIYKI